MLHVARPLWPPRHGAGSTGPGLFASSRARSLRTDAVLQLVTHLARARKRGRVDSYVCLSGGQPDWTGHGPELQMLLCGNDAGQGEGDKGREKKEQNIEGESRRTKEETSHA
ncbi:hypothetical protein DHEL01_v200964 [Diaporthe helianthi]|uniref:Uncharacterized protein n=1 Tax=Diaporthe helianthi TaxID=158607 RepID=A0A2P5IDS7_DIAHE|nr:hypothetical protein DHEL01_v200964 [Diaporthe helianthi]